MYWATALIRDQIRFRDAAATQGDASGFLDGLMVLTARYHRRRGYCCEQGCRHCPYPDSAKEAQKDVRQEENHA
jgi:hypothetical protein